MRLISTFRLLFVFPVLTAAVLGLGAQQPQAASQEISEADGVPVLLKHLPDYDQVKDRAAFAGEKTALTQAAGERPVFDAIDFPHGTEAVTAVYPVGRLVIVEYTNPQASSDADRRIQEFLAREPQPSLAYRRIGNYNAFVFDTTDEAAALALLDQVKYEKSIQWLGEDPFLIQRLERYLLTTSRDIVVSTVFFIVFGIGSAVVAGIIVGLLFFRSRDQKRAARTAFSDAGGLTRLNLDGLSD